VTGNPVRSVIFSGDRASALRRFDLPGENPLVYVTGGALGSRALNAAVADGLTTLLEAVEIVHLTGPRASNRDFDALTAKGTTLSSELRRRYRVVERVGNEIGDLFAAAALVVGRAGAGTIAELAAVGLPSILVPLPGAEEQRQNALYLSDAGAAIVIPQSELTSTRLIDAVLQLVGDPARLARMRSAARDASAVKPAARLVDEILRLACSRSTRSP
jgi:UDP-N-acetylglucosamine--N-acetylmuramyl-(pentapeptide) pyrophosphoryl-undecaprenol N-acetylglucosamine transferase